MGGVVDVNALPDGQVGITFTPRVVDEGEIISRVERMGFTIIGGQTLAGPDAGAKEEGSSFPLLA